eukprot:8694067-Pyramimonas_sp.AAC.1
MEEEADVESATSDEPGVVDAEESADDLGDAKEKPHCVVAQYGYFTITDNPKWKDCKVTTLPRWKEEMGENNRSKTITCSQYGEQKPQPRVICYLVLRAWMLWRFQQNGFAAEKASRRAWPAAETQRLRDDIARLAAPSGQTGNLKADRSIGEWAPQALSKKKVAS